VELRSSASSRNLQSKNFLSQSSNQSDYSRFSSLRSNSRPHSRKVKKPLNPENEKFYNERELESLLGLSHKTYVAEETKSDYYAFEKTESNESDVHHVEDLMHTLSSNMQSH